MKLTVKPGRDNKVHIHIDGEYRLTVDGDYWFTSPWHSKKEIDGDELEELTDEIEKRRAFNSAASLALTRLHSRGELVTKLSRKFSRENAEYAAKKCEETGLVNDRDFAFLYADELANRKNMGLSRIKLELKRKGISAELVEEALEEIEICPEEKLKEIIERKYINYLSDEKGRRRTVNALLRLGYGYSDIKRALDNFETELNEGDFFDE